eukprot:TRINITY_DN17149_c0_g1_i1.p1 TRINITY_DN17149_c0_g1~~TRINITY_DN17149_c0_g1_i1.p1  ORF type:complete len:208 (+),score=21.99 TRINITY_DN17149_c0_g1_i1:32-625(+)
MFVFFCLWSLGLCMELKDGVTYNATITITPQIFNISLPLQAEPLPLVIQLWRVSLNAQSPNIQFTVVSGSNPLEISNGKVTLSKPDTINLVVLSPSFVPFSYSIRFCYLSSLCEDPCPYNPSLGYCSNLGACIKSTCVCDNNSTSSTCYTPMEDLWNKLLGLWIVLIIVGAVITVGLFYVIYSLTVRIIYAFFYSAL